MQRLFAARPTPAQVDLAMLVLRIILGIVLAAHGAQKVFTYGLAGVTGSMTQMGAPLPVIMAPLVMAAEFLGGIAIIVGFLTRIAAAGNILVQLGAIMLVHLPNGLTGQGGYELNLLLVAMCAVLAITGAGRFSIDDRIAGSARPR